MVESIGTMVMYGLLLRNRRQQRLASSHYGFFARKLPRGQDMGSDSTRDFWKRMALKERKELGRRTMWLTTEEPAWRSAELVWSTQSFAVQNFL